jgi:hypothetical protein
MSRMIPAKRRAGLIAGGGEGSGSGSLTRAGEAVSAPQVALQSTMPGAVPDPPSWLSQWPLSDATMLIVIGWAAAGARPMAAGISAIATSAIKERRARAMRPK